jgi:hypothetical protein
MELGDDGQFSVVARPNRGEFVLIAHHDEFHVIMATSYGLLTPREEQDGVCLAHFEGNPTLAVRWALGLYELLERRWQFGAPGTQADAQNLAMN